MEQQLPVPWTPIDKVAFGHQLHQRRVLAIRRRGSAELLKFMRYESRGTTWMTVRRADTDRPWASSWRVSGGNGELSQYLSDDDLSYSHFILMPNWRQPWWSTPLWLLMSAAITVVLIALLLAIQLPGAILFLLSIAATIVSLSSVPRLGLVQIDSLESLPLDARNVVDYARKRIDGAHPEELEEAHQMTPVLERIDALRAEYGRLELDIVERIDHPALFDPSSKLTADFLALMVQAEDAADLPIADAERLASRLEIAFALARDHAQTVGLHHLPEGKRDDARRAAKTARLAKAATNDGERRAALHQLNRILDTMALHYLPPVGDTLAIEGPR